MNDSFCQSGKKTYTTRARAKATAKKIKRIGRGNTTLLTFRILRPYKCRLCGLWHLTSQGPQRA